MYNNLILKRVDDGDGGANIIENKQQQKTVARQ